jgi:hypothetical protein
MPYLSRRPVEVTSSIEFRRKSASRLDATPSGLRASVFGTYRGEGNNLNGT